MMGFFFVNVENVKTDFGAMTVSCSIADDDLIPSLRTNLSAIKRRRRKILWRLCHHQSEMQGFFFFLHCVILIMAAQQRSSIWVMFIWPVFACWPDMIVSNWWLNGPLIFVIDFRKSFSSFSSSGNSRSSTLLRATSPLISWQSAFRISKMPPRFYMFYFLFFYFPPPIFLFHSGSLLLDWF